MADNIQPQSVEVDKYKLTPEIMKKMVDYVVREFDTYSEKLHERFINAKKYYEHWIGKPPYRENTWQNSVHVPITFEAEQTISPRIFAALFPSEAPIDIEVVGDNSQDTAVKILGLTKHFFKRADVQGCSIPAIQQFVLLGTGYLEASWLYKTSWIMNNGKRSIFVSDNRPNCEFVSFFDMFPHPSKLSWQDDLPIIRRRICDAEYLKKLAAMPQFGFINIEEALRSSPVKAYTNEASNVNPNNIPENVGSLKGREEYELLEYWGGWDISYENDSSVVVHRAVPYWIMVINRSVVIRAMPNPFNHQRPPFVKFTMYPDIVPSWFGIGIGQIGQPTQERVNKIVNQRLDNVDLVMNKQGFYNGNDNLINTKKLQVSKPGQWHRVSDTVGSIRWMDIPDVTGSAYQEESLAKADFRESTGATIPLMPTDEGQHRTATGISLLQGAAGARFKPMLRRLETDLIADICHIFFSNIQQFMAIPEIVSVTGEGGEKFQVEVRPEDIQKKVNFIPTGVSEMLNKEVQIGQLLKFKEVTMQDPTINRAEINRRIGELMGFKDIDKLIVTQEPMDESIPPDVQEFIQQRKAEGASDEQIMAELRQNGMVPPNNNQQPKDIVPGDPRQMMMPPGPMGAA